jgi:hypothetical protein
MEPHLSIGLDEADMDDFSAISNFACDTCNLQDVWDSSGNSPQEPYVHRLFHEACPRCRLAGQTGLSSLCGFCQHLRLPHLFLCRPRHDGNNSAGFTVRINPFSTESADCDFCRFLAACLEVDKNSHSSFFKHRDRHGYRLMFPFAKTSPIRLANWGPESDFYIKLAIPSEQSLVPSQGKRPLQLGPYVDWSLVRQWLEASSDSLKDYVGMLPHLPKTLKDVRVIDVDNECIIALPYKAHYVACSYVWGTGLLDHLELKWSNHRHLEECGSLRGNSLPRTILDAIVACRSLGRRFLWIDRLCIIQDAPWLEKEVQLNQMGAIYHQADFTLVAAAGDGAMYGLPGVSNKRQAVQKTINFGNFELITNTPSLTDYISESQWRQRGWTVR